ncbi:MAG: LytR/AlgR family response regulator transcription factor [Flavobacteriales bacterium]|jgi:DNA-binding LytR/AlgR family response regulator
MNGKAKILVVDDDPVVLTALDVILTEFGHQLVAAVDNAMDAVVAFTLHHPDIVICDIQIKGATNGVELVRRLNEIRKAPVLFLTAYHSEETFNEAKVVAPLAFISKPIDRGALERAVALAVEHARETIGFSVNALPVDDCLYTRVGNKLKKIYIREIEYVEVDGKYSAICIGQRLINCKISLKELMEKLPGQKFVQINRNTLINLEMVEDIDLGMMNVKMPSSAMPISRTYKDNLLKRIQLI